MMVSRTLTGFATGRGRVWLVDGNGILYDTDNHPKSNHSITSLLEGP